MFDRITFYPHVLGGRACIRGTRIPVSVIVGQIAHGATEAEVLADCPDAKSAVVVIRPYEWVDFHLPVRSIDAAGRQDTGCRPVWQATSKRLTGRPASRPIP